MGVMALAGHPVEGSPRWEWADISLHSQASALRTPNLAGDPWQENSPTWEPRPGLPALEGPCPALSHPCYPDPAAVGREGGRDGGALPGRAALCTCRSRDLSSHFTKLLSCWS